LPFGPGVERAVFAAGLSFVGVTALFFSCAAPTEFFGSLRAA
jgi:hypothetical protein